MCTLSPPECILGLDLQPVLAVADLAHGGRGGVFVHQRAQAAQKLEVLGLVLVVEVILPVVGVHLGRDGGVALFRR
jgi:hypothetical protein